MAFTPISRWIRAPFLLAAIAACLVSPDAPAQRLSGEALVSALQEGGYVIVMRNARSADAPPAENEAAPGNLDNEIELDLYGQAEMSVMSYAFRTLELPVDQTLTSPAYRSKQSGNNFGFGEQVVIAELAEASEGGDASWLANRVTEPPTSGENTVIVTHGSVISEALGRNARDMETAETLVYRPRGEGRADFVARLAVDDWAKLAVN